MKRRVGIFIALLALGGCSLIDDDLSVCGVDLRIDYEMRLTMDMQVAIEAELRAESDSPVAAALRSWLEPIFEGTDHHVELCFYSDDEADEMRDHAIEEVTARRSSFTFYLPRENYMHLAVVNANGNGEVYTYDSVHSSTMYIECADIDTLPSHPTAIYTARYPIVLNDLSEDENRSFVVNLYPVSAAVALVLDTSVHRVPRMEVFLRGTASGFAVKDSAFRYDRPTIVRAEKLDARCYAAVSMPSRDALPALAPQRYMDESEALWELVSRVTLPNGKITETVLSVSEPLLAGDLEIIRCEVQDDGSLMPVGNSHVGASVTLDWKDGGEHEIDI